MFEKALSANSKCKLLLVHPHATTQIQPLFQESVRGQIECLDKYFAREDYENINTEISQTLLMLSGE
jgi:hypothetical protein